jgi:hypothetical protein
MKNAIRFAALTLVLAGAFAVNTSHATINLAAKSAAPIPVCPPTDPNGCGIGGIVSR